MPKQMVKSNLGRVGEKAVADFLSKNKIPVHQNDVAVIIPAYNEAINIGKFLSNRPSKSEDSGLQYFVVNDGSTDGTAKIAGSSGCHLIKKDTNTGLGNTIATGLVCAARLGYKIAVTMDSDGQHQYKDLKHIIQPLKSKQADLVIGSRFMGSTTMKDWVRLFGVKVYSLFVTILSGRRITDCSSGYRGYNLEKIDLLMPQENRHYTPEGTFRAFKEQLTVLEVPVTITERIGGESKQGTNFRYGARYLKAIFSAWLNVHFLSRKNRT